MRVSKRFLVRAAVIVVVLIGVTAVAATRYWNSLAANDGTPTERIWEKLSWRADLYSRKATGRVPDLSWAELWQMTRVRGGFGLEAVVNGTSVDGAIRNPYDTDEDRKAGASIFRERCAVCHGGDGTGWHGPPLNQSGLKHGDSDLAIYKVLRDGIRDTTMTAADLEPLQLWQVVGYVRTLQTHGSGDGADQHVDEAPRPNIKVSGDQIRAAGSKPDQWLTHSGSLDGRRYAPLTEITPANVSRLRIRWVHQFETDEPTPESTPLVVNGIIFTIEPPSNVVALDARSGNAIWTRRRSVPADLPLCCQRVNRGLAVLGDMLFLGSLDAYLVAINANTGNVIWQTQVARPSDGYTLTGAPLIVNQSVVVGVAGGEYGIRGFLAAYDAVTGEQQWRFHTIPGPGEPGHDSWKTDAWQTGGGPTWITGSYDPSLDLLYWGVGNPAPDFSGDIRPGDNLFTNSVVALHASSGKLAWHFQFTPHDEHDWDSTQTPILADVSINGTAHRAICWANRNGFYYVLDRATGEFLVGTPFVEQNWAKGLDATGRPILSDSGQLSNVGRLTRPGVGGGTNWQNAALDRERGLFFVHATDSASVFTKSVKVSRGPMGLYQASAGSVAEPLKPVVRALDLASGVKRWENFSPPIRDVRFSYSGLLATAGGLVFGASSGSVFALDSTNGRELWRVELGGDTRAAPISFAVDGRQVVLVSAGRALFEFGL